MFGLFKCIFEQVEGAIGQILNMQNLVEQGVGTIAKGMVQQVTGGIWIGNGANKFVDKMNTEFMSLVSQATGHTSSMQQKIRQAEEIVRQADAECVGIVNSLSEMFAGIY